MQGKVWTQKNKFYPCTDGLKEIAGMDKRNKKYVFINIVPFYPDFCNAPIIRVIIKIDSQPGQFDAEAMARLHELGFCIIHIYLIQQLLHKKQFKNLIRSKIMFLLI